MRTIVSLSLVALAACTPVDDNIEYDDSNCGDLPPAFDTIAVTDAGTIAVKGEDRRAIQVAAQVSDDDGDLHQHSVLVWYDEFIDGSLDGVPQIDIDVALSPDKPCGVEFGTLGALIPLGGDDVPFGTELEWGMVIYDAAGHPSNAGKPKVAVWRTPEE